MQHDIVDYVVGIVLVASAGMVALGLIINSTTATALPNAGASTLVLAGLLGLFVVLGYVVIILKKAGL